MANAIRYLLSHADWSDNTLQSLGTSSRTPSAWVKSAWLKSESLLCHLPKRNGTRIYRGGRGESVLATETEHPC